jgi:hypothetical protein
LTRHEGHLLFMHRSALPGRQKSKPLKGVTMQQTKQQPLFSLGQIVATPGALAALEKAGQSPAEVRKMKAVLLHASSLRIDS